MMKYYLSCSALLFCMLFSKAQNIGIGTTNPTSNLHIKSDKDYILRIIDGTNTDNEQFAIAAADATGLLVKTPTTVFKKIAISTLGASGVTLATEDTWEDTGTTISLEVGRWLVQTAIAIEPSADVSSFIGDYSKYITVLGSLADSTGALVPTQNIEGDSKGTFGGNGLFRGILETPSTIGVMKGLIVINNNSGSTKTYRLIAKLQRGSAGLSAINIKEFAKITKAQNLLFALPFF
ncbi:hypothetical protein [Chryseobacterium oryzae]|uniref:Uncharacterized protein n=1 Tax=Chryseobacterium oryzae TaxID=2929799 RepID=A0ABY4BJW4_9FLAO|nr:hypothetical protein [Chryseobacterium oryzae]UOE39360.1 hypothetical protein MTP08_06190 [Chryseobacterium oryzae]